MSYGEVLGDYVIMVVGCWGGWNKKFSEKLAIILWSCGAESETATSEDSV